MDHILIIDDSATVRAQMAQWLEDMGYDVALADGGHAGFRAVRSDPSDLIILDLGLPDMDGLGVFTNLRSEEDGSRVPVVVLTSSDAEQDRIRSLEMGAEGLTGEEFERIDDAVGSTPPNVTTGEPAPPPGDVP